MDEQPKKVSDLIKVLESNLHRSPSPAGCANVSSPAARIGQVANVAAKFYHKNVQPEANNNNNNAHFHFNDSSAPAAGNQTSNAISKKGTRHKLFSLLNKPILPERPKNVEQTHKGGQIFLNPGNGWTENVDTTPNLHTCISPPSYNSKLEVPKNHTEAVQRVPSPFLQAQKLQHNNNDGVRDRFSFDNAQLLLNDRQNSDDEIYADVLSSDTITLLENDFSDATDTKHEPPPVPPKPRCMLSHNKNKTIDRRYSWPISDAEFFYAHTLTLAGKNERSESPVFKEGGSNEPDWTSRLRSKLTANNNGRGLSSLASSRSGAGHWSSKRAKRAARLAKRSFVTHSGDFTSYATATGSQQQHFMLRVQSIASTSSQPSSLYSGSGSDYDEISACGTADWSGKEKFSKLYHAANEFYTSEKQYVKILQILSEELPSFIEQESKKLRRALISPDFCKSLIANLSPLLGLHKNLCDSFRKAISNWNEHDPGIAKILNDIGPFIKMSTQFLRLKSALVQQIVDNCKRNFDFKCAIREFEKKHFNGLFITHQFDCVHQRICRYPLLISSYLKYLDQTSHEYQKSLTAKKLLESIANDIEDSFAQDDEMRHLYQIQRRLVGSKFEILAPGRKFIKEGEILKHSRKEMQSRVLLLFNDVLLYCAYVLGTNNLSLRYDFDLATARISVPRSDRQLEEENYSFHIIGKQRSIIVVARSYEELVEWTTAIENASSELKRRLENDHQTPRHASCGDFGNFTLSVDKTNNNNYRRSTENLSITTGTKNNNSNFELGKIAPVWIPDDKVTMCQYCKINFTKLRRRHHCRACGKVICGDCCGEAPLEYANFDPQIICPTCFKSLLSFTLDKKSHGSNGTNCGKNSSHGGGFRSLKSMGHRRHSFLSIFKAPKNCEEDEDSPAENHEFSYRNNEPDNGIALDGYLYMCEKRTWSRYWSVLRRSGVLEFYSASGDPVCKKNIVLLSYEVRTFTDNNAVHNNNNQNYEESLYFDLVHVNQIVTDENRKEIRYSFKGENPKSAQSWIEALSRFKIL